MIIQNWEQFNEEKEQFSTKGNFKKVYLSKSNGNLIIKKYKEPNSIIKDSEILYSDNPNLFAKVYKIDYLRKIIIQEKLDIELPKEDLKKLYIFLNSKKIFDNMDIYTFLYPVYSVMELLKSFYNDIFKYDIRLNEYSFDDISSIIDDKNIMNIFLKWTTYLKTLSLIKNIDNKFIDVRIDNFGYDPSGNLKMFDI